MAATATSGRALGGRMRQWTRTFRLAYWLGWKIESNWTDPFRFAIYQLLRPLGGALILFFMYRVVAGGRDPALLAFFIVGSAFWPFVLTGMQGMAMGIISDREHWKMLRYVYTAPIPYRAYLVGRSMAQTTSSLAACVVTLTVGALALGVALSPGQVDLPYSLAAFVVGIVAVVAMGLVIVSVALSVAGEAWRLPEAASAALYLVSGAIFPITVLPELFQVIARAMPITWWLEAMRRGLLGEGVTRSLPAASDAEVFAGLVLRAAIALGLALSLHAVADRRARRLGILDRESGF